MRKLLWWCFAVCLTLLLFFSVCLSIRTIPEDWPQTWTHWDINGLSQAVGTFRERFHVGYIPSRIKLSETCNYPDRDRPNTLDYDSVRYLKALWPKMRLEAGTKVDWNGDGRIGGDHVLEGDECLVYFLGGIPVTDPPGRRGFANDPHDPTDTSVRVRIGPFFDFKSSQLVDRHGRGFFSYLDGYGKQPFAYFSSYGKANGYNRYGDSDCSTLGVSPYALTLAPVPRYVNPNGFQLVSAGADKTFGPGGLWDPTTGTERGVGTDDLSNFSAAPLGMPQQ
jgi:hypothetical protein